MNKVRRFIFILFALLMSCSMIIGCTVFNKEIVSNEKMDRHDIFAEDIDKLSAWVTYWNLDVDDEVAALNSKLSSVSYFEAYFDSENKLYIPDELVGYYNKTKDKNYEKYITIVNDKEDSNGDISLKDTDLLRDLLKDSDSISNHINDILDFQKQYGFDGIEIDYENIKKDMQLWGQYINFINELYTKCEENNIKLRVVLEPGIPVENLNFKEGPVYVIMCYNLHGTSTKPGEKANKDFVQKIIDKMSIIPGEKEFALATGGFDWTEDDKVASVDEETASELASKYNSTEVRDSDSMYINFKYSDEKGKEHEVWYADTETINELMKVIDDNGYRVSIWRLGGNLF